MVQARLTQTEIDELVARGFNADQFGQGEIHAQAFINLNPSSVGSVTVSGIGAPNDTAAGAGGGDGQLIAQAKRTNLNLEQVRDQKLFSQPVSYTAGGTPNQIGLGVYLFDRSNTTASLVAVTDPSGTVIAGATDVALTSGASAGTSSFTGFLQGESKVLIAPIQGDAEDNDPARPYRPAYGDPLFSANPSDRNGIPANAQSIWMMAKMIPIGETEITREIINLWRILGAGTLDGSTPVFDPRTSAGVSYPFSYQSKLVIPADQGPNLRVVGNYVGAEDYRPYIEVSFSTTPVALPTFEPALIEFQHNSQQTSQGITTTLTFPASSTTSNWVALPTAATKFASLRIPPNSGATSISFEIRRQGETIGLPLLDTTVTLPATGGYVGKNDLNNLIGISACLGGLHEIRGVLDTADATVKEFVLLSP